MTRNTDPNNLPAIPTRIQKGAALLDLKIPNWHLQIDLETLNMNWCYACIIGQLFPHPIGYTEGILSLGLNYTHKDDSQQEHGFEAYGFGDQEEEYNELTEAWKTEILRRRAA
jgi:hypothetical protein